MKILFSGDRNFTDGAYIHSIISNYADENLTIINGGCTGVDMLATNACNKLKVPVKIYMAEWRRCGKKAGPIRNTRMIVEELPDLIIAIHPDIQNSKGTKNMINQAIQSNIQVLLYDGVSNIPIVCNERMK